MKYIIPHKKSRGLLAVLLAIAIFLVGIYILLLLPIGKTWYPMGWDAGYYISRVQYYIGGEIRISDSGMLRSGYIVFSALLVKVSGLSARTMEILLPPVILLGLAAIAAGIVKTITKNWTATIVAAVCHLFFPNNLRLTQSVSANLLAIFILYGIVFCIIKYYFKPKIVIPVIVAGTVIIGITHIETLVFTLAFFLISGILIFATASNKRNRIFAFLYFLTIPILGIIATLFFAPRSDSVRGLLKMYLSTNNLLQNDGGFTTSFLNNHTIATIWTGANSALHYSAMNILSVMGLGGFLIITYTFIRYRNIWSGLFLSFCLTVMTISAFSYGQESFVYQRVNLLWPLPMLAIVTYWVCCRLLRPVQKKIFTVAILTVLITQGALTARSYYLFIQPESITQTEHLGRIMQQYPEVSQWDILVFVNDDIASNTPTYHLWADNIAAILPPELGPKICIYGATHEDYTLTKNEYSDTSLYSLDLISRDSCLRAPSNNVAIIRSFYTPWVEKKSLTGRGVNQIYGDSQIKVVLPQSVVEARSRQ